jgi:hypothetical protein
VPIDLLLAYDWPYDRPFLSLLDETLASAGGALLPIGPENLAGALDRLRAANTPPRAYLDRATDTSPEFGPLDDWAERNIPLHLNPGERRRQAWYKTNLHWAFIRAGIHTPYTIAIPSMRRQAALEPPADLPALGLPFSIKPDLGGGGWGVVTNATSWDDVVGMRRLLPNEDLILQQFVEPGAVGGRRGWFRVLAACGRVFPCWWDDQTHLFGPPVTADEAARLGLGPLWAIAETAARISGLQIFSTEVALVPDGRFIVVDYVNDPVDLRFQPHAREGMPVAVARAIAEAISRFLTEPPEAGTLGHS